MAQQKRLHRNVTIAWWRSHPCDHISATTRALQRRHLWGLLSARNVIKQNQSLCAASNAIRDARVLVDTKLLGKNLPWDSLGLQGMEVHAGALGMPTVVLWGQTWKQHQEFYHSQRQWNISQETQRQNSSTASRGTWRVRRLPGRGRALSSCCSSRPRGHGMRSGSFHERCVVQCGKHRWIRNGNSSS